MEKQFINNKVICPFCEGDGCCNCDHTGKVLVGEQYHFKTTEEASNHDPEVSLYDLRYNRVNGLDLNYKPF